MELAICGLKEFISYLENSGDSRARELAQILSEVTKIAPGNCGARGGGNGADQRVVLSLLLEGQTIKSFFDANNVNIDDVRAYGRGVTEEYEGQLTTGKTENPDVEAYLRLWWFLRSAFTGSSDSNEGRVALDQQRTTKFALLASLLSAAPLAVLTVKHGAIAIMVAEVIDKFQKLRQTRIPSDLLVVSKLLSVAILYPAARISQTLSPFYIIRPPPILNTIFLGLAKGDKVDGEWLAKSIANPVQGLVDHPAISIVAIPQYTAEGSDYSADTVARRFIEESKRAWRELAGYLFSRYGGQIEGLTPDIVDVVTSEPPYGLVVSLTILNVKADFDGKGGAGNLWQQIVEKYTHAHESMATSKYTCLKTYTLSNMTRLCTNCYSYPAIVSYTATSKLARRLRLRPREHLCAYCTLIRILGSLGG